MAGIVIEFPIVARPPRPVEVPADGTRGGLLHTLFGGLVAACTQTPPLPASECPPLTLERATILQGHLKHVHDLIETLGPAEASDICRKGLEAAEDAVLKECGE